MREKRKAESEKRHLGIDIRFRLSAFGYPLAWFPIKMENTAALGGMYLSGANP